MALAKLNKRAVDALAAPASGQAFLWDTEIKGFGIRVGATGTKTFVIQYMNEEGRVRRVKIGRFGVMTVEQARELAKIQLGKVASGEDPAEESRRVRKELNVAEMCEWYLVEARAGRILGRKNRPIKDTSLNMDESRIRTHIIPLMGKRLVRKLTIADVEAMQNDIAIGQTRQPPSGGRGGRPTGGAGVAGRSLGTLQAILGHAKHKGLIAEHPTKGAKKLATKKKTRRLSIAEIELLGRAIGMAELGSENPVALAIVRTLLLTGYRREEAQAMQRHWVNPMGGYVAFPDTKSDAQFRAIGPEAIKIVVAQPEIAGCPYVFPASNGEGPFTAVSDCLARLCRSASIEGVTPHTLRHTFGSMAGELGFSELTIRAMLGHASQSVTQDYVHIDEAVKLAVSRTSDEIAKHLETGVRKAAQMKFAA
ncbi:MAG: site-specific integrase [Sphingopyxis sp.]|nr:site-specific integrase [Sphingopyxis sp.]